MAKQGHLNLKNAQYSMPADAAAYQSPPFYYRNTRSISVAFETDIEAALQALPAPLAIAEPATAVLSFYESVLTTRRFSRCWSSTRAARCPTSCTSR
jgi:acetoacetate decarboxylase